MIKKLIQHEIQCLFRIWTELLNLEIRKKNKDFYIIAHHIFHIINH